MRERLGILIMAVLLIGAACGDDDTLESAVPTTASAPASTAAPATTAATVSTEAAVSSGDPEGGARTGALLLLADDFADGDADGWEIDYGWYVLGAGEDFRLASSGSAWVWWPAGEQWPPGYVLRCSFRIDAGGIAVSLGVGAEGRYVIHLHEDGTDLLVDRPWGTFETLASGPAVSPAEWHFLTAGFAGGEIQAYVDGTPLVGAVVDDPLPGGSVGFGALAESVVSFDNVYVNLLAGGLPPFDGPSAAPEPAPEPPAVEEPPGEEPEGEGPGEEPSGGTVIDLSVTNVTFFNPITVAGDPVPITVWVVNEGTEPVRDFEVAWEAMGSVCAGTEEEVLPGDRAYVSCTAPGLPSGLHHWTVHVDHDDRIAEVDEGNNILTGIIEVVPEGPSRPDLIIYAVTPDTPPVGEPFDIEVGVIDDNRTDWEGSFEIRFVLDGAVVCSRRETGGLVPSLFCTLPAMSAGSHVLEILVDPDDEVAETRDDNNRIMKEYQIAPG